MESLDDTPKSKSFIKHVFNFEEDGKTEMLNIIQYALLGMVPIIVLNKLMQKYVPEADDSKSSLEIVAEIVVQVITMFIGILIIHRIITFVPTYSGVKYPEFNVVFIVLAVLMITMSLQTKLGEKVSILVDRVNDLWEGNTDKKKKKGGKNGNVKVSQPISGQTTSYPVNQMASTSSYSDGTSINSLPAQEMAQSQQYTMSPQQLPDYNKMYSPGQTPLVNAATPGGGLEPFDSGPVAANSVMGGFGGFSSW